MEEVQDVNWCNISQLNTRLQQAQSRKLSSCVNLHSSALCRSIVLRPTRFLPRLCTSKDACEAKCVRTDIDTQADCENTDGVNWDWDDQACKVWWVSSCTVHGHPKYTYPVFYHFRYPHATLPYPIPPHRDDTTLPPGPTGLTVRPPAMRSLEPRCGSQGIQLMQGRPRPCDRRCWNATGMNGNTARRKKHV